MNTRQRIFDFIQKELLEDREPVELNEDTELFTSHVLDSMDLLELTAFFEEEFTVKLKPAQIVPENINTISAMTLLIERQKALTAG